MFSHIIIGSNNIQVAKQFYDATFSTLGYKPGIIDEKGRCFYITDSGVFGVSIPINGEPASHGNGSTIGFKVKNPEMIEQWHAAGVANGGCSCEEPPGDRGDYYAAYLRDPSGNKLCALYRKP